MLNDFPAVETPSGRATYSSPQALATAGQPQEPQVGQSPTCGSIEEWRLLVDWPYEISSLGRIRRIGSGLILRPHIDSRGYLAVTLHRVAAKKRQKFRV